MVVDGRGWLWTMFSMTVCLNILVVYVQVCNFYCGACVLVCVCVCACMYAKLCVHASIGVAS